MDAGHRMRLKWDVRSPTDTTRYLYDEERLPGPGFPDEYDRRLAREAHGDSTAIVAPGAPR